MKNSPALPKKVDREACIRCNTLLPSTLLRPIDTAGTFVCLNEAACRRRQRQRKAKPAKAAKP